MFKLIASDIDGTLINKDHSVTKYTQDIFAKAQAAGYEIVIATGRDYDSASEVVHDLGFEPKDIAIISNNGMHVSYPRGNYYVSEPKMSFEDCRVFEQLGQKFYMGILYLTKEGIYFQMDERSLQDYQLGLDADRMIYFNERLKTEHIRGIDDIKHTFDSGSIVEKMVYIQHPDYLELMKERLVQAFDPTYALLMVSPGWAEIMPRHINKGDALIALAEQMGISAQATIAFGDSDNDLTLIQRAGRGVAMANARNSLKIIADDITLTNEENGVAHYIEQHLLNQ